jgi:hypothetical protein
LGVEYRSLSSLLCIFLYSFVTSSLLCHLVSTLLRRILTSQYKCVSVQNLPGKSLCQMVIVTTV